MKQTCILILGMHRSGTSALSGTLSLLDVYLGTDLIKPQEQNAKGFFENTNLNKLNEKILAEADSSWDDVFFTESKLDAIENTVELESLLKKEFNDSNLFAIKDPRLAYLFPLYAQALTNMNVDIKVIIPFRNPLEVARSLKNRDEFSQRKGLLLWAYNFLLSEKLSRNFPRVFIYFDELVQSPQAVIMQIDKKLKLNLAFKYNDRKKEVNEFLTPNLKHHNITLNRLSEDVPKLIHDIVSLMPNINETEQTAKFDSLHQQLFGNQQLFYNDDFLKDMQDLEQAKKELQSKNEELEKIKEELQTKEELLDQMASTLQVKELELEQTKNELIEVYISNSWKVTRPLRKISKFINRRRSQVT